MSDKYKETIHLETRQKNSQQVVIQFVDATKVEFHVLCAEDEFDKKSGIKLRNKGDPKYNGKVIGNEPHKDDYCTCPNFTPNNNDNYVNEHGYAYQCKHILKARADRFPELTVV